MSSNLSLKFVGPHCINSHSFNELLRINNNSLFKIKYLLAHNNYQAQRIFFKAFQTLLVDKNRSMILEHEEFSKEVYYYEWLRQSGKKSECYKAAPQLLS